MPGFEPRTPRFLGRQLYHLSRWARVKLAFARFRPLTSLRHTRPRGKRREASRLVPRG